MRDQIRGEAREVLDRLKAQGRQVRVVSGDMRGAALSIGRELGLAPEEVVAEVKPDQKAGIIRGLQAAGHRVAFVGDGINDAPALAQADLGIAVTQASDVARESADLVLLRADLRAVPESLGLARAALATIRQNLFWAFFYNAAAVSFAALGFMNPMLCAAAMGISDVLVIGNSLRLLRWRGRV
jgi:Cu+-exporting ATPase